MQTIVQPPSESTADDDLQLLLVWPRDPDEPGRVRKAAIGTLLVHLLVIGALATMPTQMVDRAKVPERTLRITKLIDPPMEFTQKAPNKGKVSKELIAPAIAPTPRVQSPAPGTAARKFSPPPSPQPQARQPVAGPSLVEPPKIEQAQANAPQFPMTQLQPQMQQQERPANDTKPKLAFETPAAARTPATGAPRITLPGGSVQDAVRDVVRGGGRGVSGSDVADLGSGAGLNLPPSPSRPRMDYELKTDSQGVDFRPYILQILATIRRNWYAVYPESAKLGTRGKVVLEFAIANNGSITKVAYSEQSGAQALDRAAVAAISASNPLPPLPPGFHGERIVLAFTFSYNLPR